MILHPGSRPVPNSPDYQLIRKLSAGGGQPAIPSADQANKKLQLFWLSRGDKDTLMKSNKAFHDNLTEKKVTHIWHIDAGPHEWAVWRNDLYLVGPMLFRERK